MMFHVWYYSYGHEGWDSKCFDNFSEAVSFAEKQIQSEIYKVDKGGIPLAYNINLNIS